MWFLKKKKKTITKLQKEEWDKHIKFVTWALAENYIIYCYESIN
jgi:hypothetical protein